MERPTAALEKIKDCLQHDSCGELDCVYFCNFKELQCVMAWVEELEEAYLVSCKSMQVILDKIEALEEKTNTCSHLEGEHGQTTTDSD